MRVDASRFVPVLVRFADDASRAETWGRLLSLSPDGARLICRAPVPGGSLLLLDFEIFGDAFTGVEGLVADTSVDQDGYTVAPLSFRRTQDRLAVGRVVRRVVSSELPDER
jgi:hypothetical protein